MGIKFLPKHFSGFEQRQSAHQTNSSELQHATQHAAEVLHAARRISMRMTAAYLQSLPSDSSWHDALCDETV